MQHRILVVDDDPTIRMVITAQLKHFSSAKELSTAANGLEAVNLYQEHGCDLIFMDIQMPEMTGLEATRAIRELERNPGSDHCTIVAVTGTPDQERCFESGMDDFLLKPIMMKDVTRILEKWLPTAAER